MVPAKQGLSPATIAVIFVVTASVFLAGTTLLAKVLGTDALGPALPPLMVTFGRFLFAWLFISASILGTGFLLGRPAWGLHLMRTSCGVVGVTLMFAAAAAIPLADATAIIFLNPVFCMILSIPLLGERIGKWRWLATALAFLGALVLIQPGTSAMQIGALLALGAAAIIGLELIFLKRLSVIEAPLQLLFFNNLIGVPLATLAALTVWQMPSLEQWGAMAALGFVMACGQFCMINALARAEASFVTPFSYLTLVFAALYDILLFAVWPTWLSLTGAALIIAGAALLAWREARLRT